MLEAKLADVWRRSTSRMKERARLATILGVALIGVTLNVASFYPGYMSNDSLSQLASARSGTLDDWNPPIMSLLWRVVDRVSPGPQGMLLLHNLSFWLGLALLCHLAIRPTAIAALMVLLIGLFPPIFGLLGTVWKDVGLTCALLTGISLLAFAQVKASWRALIGAIPFLFYALSVRHEGVLAVLPVCIWAGLIAGHLPGAPVFVRGRRIGIGMGLVVCLVLVAVNSAIIRLTVKGKPSHPEQVLLIYDLVYLSRLSHQWLLPPYLTEAGDPQAQLRELERFFDEKECAVRYCMDLYNRYRFTTDKQELRQLRSVWLSAVLDRLGQYVRMKRTLFENNYAVGTRWAPYSFHSGIDPNNLGVHLHESWLNTAVMRMLGELRHTAFFRTWYYLAGLLMLLAVLVALGAHPLHPAVLVAASALLKEALYVTWWSTYDFRYHWWTVFAVFLVPLVWLASRRVAPAPEGMGLRQRILGRPSPWMPTTSTGVATVATRSLDGSTSRL
jgi:hypothetical protein